MRSTPHRPHRAPYYTSRVTRDPNGRHAKPRARQADGSPKKQKHPRIDTEGAGQSPTATTRGYLRVCSPLGWVRMKRWATRSGVVVVVVARIRNALRTRQ